MISVRYLLDTNVLSEPARPRPEPSVMQRLLAHKDDVATTAPAWQELLYGYHRAPDSRRREFLGRYLNDIVRTEIPILPYDAAAAEWHAAERARLVTVGRTPQFADGQIAAIAATNDLTLVTANWADFRHFDGLQVEDWRS
jgi:tRNA(fMet)-specific endonuclease VapC